MSPDSTPESNSSGSSRPYAETTGSSSQLLQQMLEATLLDSKSQLTPDEWQSLRATAAAAHAGGLGMTEFTEALVKELLSLRFANLRQDEASSKRLCHKIATTLSSDPYARQRIVEFQQHLLRSPS